MHLVSNKYAVISEDLEFLAFSFARMRFQGRNLRTEAITGNMDENSKAWFLQRYDFYFKQLQEEHPVE